METFTQAAHDVLAERQRQIQDEGWSTEHDDHHRGGEMAIAASCYAMHGLGRGTTFFNAFVKWPWDLRWFKPASKRQNLVKAAALLIAEIERLDRAKARGEGGEHG